MIYNCVTINLFKLNNKIIINAINLRTELTVYSRYFNIQHINLNGRYTVTIYAVLGDF